MIDVCVNLTNGQFRDDLDDVLSRATHAGVVGMLFTATTLDDVKASSARCDGTSMLCTAGIHPHDAKDARTNWLDELRELTCDPTVRAVGECGLDFNRNFSPRDVQEAVFAAQIEVAVDACLPLFVHDRESDGAVLAHLDAYTSLPPTVIHCFTGTADELDAYIERGFYIGITGWVCDHRRGESLRGLVGRIPLENLLVETDAPFLKPHNAPETGRRNEPAYLRYVIEGIAQCRPESFSELAETTACNARRLFGFS